MTRQRCSRQRPRCSSGPAANGRPVTVAYHRRGGDVPPHGRTHPHTVAVAGEGTVFRAGGRVRVLPGDRVGGLHRSQRDGPGEAVMRGTDQQITIQVNVQMFAVLTALTGLGVAVMQNDASAAQGFAEMLSEEGMEPIAKDVIDLLQAISRDVSDGPRAPKIDVVS